MKKSPQLEKHFQTKVLKQLREIPCSYWIKLNDRATIGLPDIVGVLAGHFFAIELKTGTKPTKLQLHTLKRLMWSGAHCFVSYPHTWEMDFKEITRFAAEFDS